MSELRTDWPQALCDWYDENRRELPFRAADPLTGRPLPYRVWISEIMLQQTRIETVIPYFERFMAAFPTVFDLAAASEEEVLKLWEGLGYYSRARNLHKAAQVIAARSAGTKQAEQDAFPRTAEELAKLPGIGPYTAGAIAAIAFNEPATAVDGNVLRVAARLYALEDNVLDEKTRRHVESLLRDVYPTGRASSFVQGLMELGEVVCLPENPKCAGRGATADGAEATAAGTACPMAEFCRAYQQGLTDKLPVRIPKTKRTEEELAVLRLYREDGALLLAKRTEQKGVLRGMYELPNVGISSELSKLFLEKYGLQVTDLALEAQADHVFTHITWHMKVYAGRLADGNTGADYVGRCFFATADELEHKISLPTAFKKLL